MKIKRIEFKNCLAIKEMETKLGNVVEIKGASETGKTSILDSIRKGLENYDARTKFVNKDSDGEDGEIIIELDNGMEIIRKVDFRNSKSKSLEVKDGRKTVRSPQSFLNNLLGKNNFNPVEFFNKSEKEKTKELLGLIPIKITEEEIEKMLVNKVRNIDYSMHGLEVANVIEKELSEYRRECGREKKSVKGAVEELQLDLPRSYKPEEFRNVKLSEKFNEISMQDNINNEIETANMHINNGKEKVKDLQQQKETALDNEDERYQEELKAIEEKHNEKINNLNNTFNKKLDDQDLRIIEARDYLKENKFIDTTKMKENVETLEQGKEMLKLYDRMMQKDKERIELDEEYKEYTSDINKIRKLPAMLLKKVKSPIEGLEVKNGTVMINGLPLDNLSDGAMMKLAVEIAKQTSGELKTILLNGFEQFNSELQKKLLKEFKNDDYQLIITNVTDGDLQIISDNIDTTTGEIIE
jgi:hypothetical protein